MSQKNSFLTRKFNSKRKILGRRKIWNFQKKYLDNKYEKIYFKSLNNKTVELSDGFILMKSSGRECLIAYTKNKKYIKKSILIYNTP